MQNNNCPKVTIGGDGDVGAGVKIEASKKALKKVNGVKFKPT